MKKISTTFLAILAAYFQVAAQDVGEILKNNNKLTSVHVILLIILTGIILFLIIQDKKIKKLEDRLNNKS